jgi:hypothetical protein
MATSTQDKIISEGSIPFYTVDDGGVGDKIVPTKGYVDTSLGIGGVTADAAEINKLDGLLTTKTELGKLAGAGAIVASGTQHAHVVALKVNYTTGDLDIEAEIIAALNTTNTAINAIFTALQAFGINAAS